jgi:hypothetical protein
MDPLPGGQDPVVTPDKGGARESPGRGLKGLAAGNTLPTNKKHQYFWGFMYFNSPFIRAANAQQ